MQRRWCEWLLPRVPEVRSLLVRAISARPSLCRASSPGAVSAVSILVGYVCGHQSLRHWSAFLQPAWVSESAADSGQLIRRRGLSPELAVPESAAVIAGNG